MNVSANIEVNVKDFEKLREVKVWSLRYTATALCKQAWAGEAGHRIPVEAIFSAPVHTGLGAHPAPPIQWVPGNSRGNAARAWR